MKISDVIIAKQTKLKSQNKVNIWNKGSPENISTMLARMCLIARNQTHTKI